MGHQVLQRRCRIGQCGHQKAVTLGALDPRHHSQVRIDHDKRAVGRNGWGIAKLEREIELLADKDQQISRGNSFSKAAERRVL